MIQIQIICNLNSKIYGVNYFLTFTVILMNGVIFAQTSTDVAEKQILRVELEENSILQGNVDLASNPELFVGQTYIFTIISNDKNWDLKIQSENLNITLEEESRKTTGGLTFKGVPLDTGDCSIVLYITNAKGKQVCLLAMKYHASKCPMPPVFVAGIRSGEIIHGLSASADLSCKYGPGSGIFKGYSILSWSGQLGDKKFSGTGAKLSREFIEAINLASSDEVLRLTVELSDNDTGYKESEAVYLIK